MFNIELDEKLIALVQRNECIYNMSHKHYSDKVTKNKAWKKISGEIGVPVQGCISRWKKLRDGYRKAIILRKKRGGSISRPLKFQDDLEFLDPHLQERSTADDKSEQSSERYPSPTPQFETVESPELTPSVPVAQIDMPSYYPQSEMSKILQYVVQSTKGQDPIESFFSCMAKTVKKMPSKMQAEIKREVFRVVNDAEIKLSQDLDSDNEVKFSGHSNRS